MGKLITIALLLATIYSGFTIMLPGHKKASIKDVIVMKDKVETYNKIIKEVTSDKREFDKKHTAEKKVKTEKKDNLVFTKNKNIILKIKKYSILNDNLISDMYVYNRSNNKISKKIEIKCFAYQDNQKVDLMSWIGNINLKPEEVILLKDMNFGYVTANGFDKLDCVIN